jgi:hypothetical protein
VKEAFVRTILSVLVLLLLVSAARPAHAVLSAIGYVGYGHTFADVGSGNFGPTIEIGGSFGVPFVDIDLTYWNVLDDASHASQIRLGVRVDPPLIPIYGRVAAGLPFDSDVRDAQGLDIVLGAGVNAFSIPLLKINVELDYHAWTNGSGIHPLEIKVGAIVGF